MKVALNWIKPLYKKQCLKTYHKTQKAMKRNILILFQ